jgi:hypothetical protein
MENWGKDNLSKFDHCVGNIGFFILTASNHNHKTLLLWDSAFREQCCLGTVVSIGFDTKQ